MQGRVSPWLAAAQSPLPLLPVPKVSTLNLQVLYNGVQQKVQQEVKVGRDRLLPLPHLLSLSNNAVNPPPTILN